MSFRLRFWGTRGSIPSPGPATVRYGGNTPSIEVRTPSGSLVLLDAGTGIRELGRALIARANGAPITGDIYLTHAHWDHIQGFPFFAPAFQRGNRFTIWGTKSLAASIRRVVRDQMSPVVFPVAFEELAATFDFRELIDEQHVSDGFDVRAFSVRHPGGALGYRFTSRNAGNTDDGSAFVYISDNELRDRDQALRKPQEQRRARQRAARQRPVTERGPLALEAGGVHSRCACAHSRRDIHRGRVRDTPWLGALDVR